MTFGILVFIYLTLTMIVGENGLLTYIKLKSMQKTLLSETMAMKKQNEEARSQVDAMESEPDRVEELAREYGLTQEGELIFKFDGVQPPSDN